MIKHNEDSRVKIPTILHLISLGYEYLPLSTQKWDVSTNIFTDIFTKSIQRINPELSLSDISRFYDKISLCLENEDLGRAFYNKLVDKSKIRLIDFENFENNTFNVVTELTYKKDDEEFRPDIIILINGMPLSFIEVKIPNNDGGMTKERDRMETRSRNKKFRKFINLIQFMVFSNNEEYDDESLKQLRGSFYATTSYTKQHFNYFREEDKFDLESLLKPVSHEVETLVLKDNNLLAIRSSKEFKTNKNPNRPTNRICTSLFQKKRLAFLLEFSIAYVKEYNGLEKHIMRYPQIFATKAIERKLDEGVKKGIIWHTQGSGKTALAYYNVKFLTQYYSKKGVVPKFYFIVDRLDLLKQAAKEFAARGLLVYKINSRENFAKDIKSNVAFHNDLGDAEITVVNIQKFQDDPSVIKNNDYNLEIQRVFFLDEVHRSYNPKGSFLANLEQADKHSIKIGLTGTPLLGSEYNSRSLFGDYIHKYYYNASIKDGYTLRLIREEIETSYKFLLEQTIENIKLLKGNADKREVYAHHKFVEPMLDYIVKDFETSRISMNDNSIGGMVVCDSSDQARMMIKIFQAKYVEGATGAAYLNNALDEDNNPIPIAASNSTSYTGSNGSFAEEHKRVSKVKTAALILHNAGTKKEIDGKIDDFKAGKIDLLFVYNMLLTGFDAKRLKKLYLGRVIKSHNLLQALTRVNRTYKEFKYGFVVDFAGIREEFDKTNQDYFRELQSELGDEIEHYSDLFKSKEEIETEIAEIKEVLFQYDIDDAEKFSDQISEINDRSIMLMITKVLNNAKALYNLLRLSGDTESIKKLDFRKLTVLSREASARLAVINERDRLESGVDTTNLLNVALEEVMFAFTKVKEEEMVLADKLKDTLRKTREMLGGNFDHRDPEFISLKEELERLFKKKNLSEVTKEEMEANIIALDEIYAKAKELERKNRLLSEKYNNDEKYARLHKRLMEKDPLTDSEQKLCEALQGLKEAIDGELEHNSKVLENENYASEKMTRLVIEQMKFKHHLDVDIVKVKFINSMILKEYMNEFYGRTA